MKTLLSLTRKQFTELMIQYGFARFPRAAGSPSQAMVYKFDHFLQFFKINNDTNPVFVSTNSYYEIDIYGNPTQVFLERIFLDLDTDNGQDITDAHDECKRVARYCLDHNIPFVVSFSGNGFHFHLLLKPEVRSLDMWLSQAVKAIQYQFKKELNLKTINTQCAEPKRLVRVPFSRYVCKASGSNQWIVNKNYCIPLTLNQLMNMKTSEIIELSYKPI